MYNVHIKENVLVKESGLELNVDDSPTEHVTGDDSTTEHATGTG